MIELYGCNKELLLNKVSIEQIMHEAALRANATIVQEFFHQFSPFGVSGTVVIAESHINIHTWPEHHYAAVDIFTCGESLDSQKAVDYLAEILEATASKVSKIERGSLDEIKAIRASKTPNHLR